MSERSMNENLQKVIDKLETNGMYYRILKMKDRALTVNDVVKFSEDSIKPDEICKTLIMKDKKGNFFAATTLGNDRVDFKKVRDFFKCSKLSLANPDEILKVTGMEIGAVCPLILDLPYVVDEKVLKKKKINFGAGDVYYGIEIQSSDLLKCVKGNVSKISK